MKKLTTALFCIVFLAGCQRANELGTRLGFNKQTQTQMIEGSNYYEFPEVSPGKQYKSESTFCYKMQTDILCYDQPRKGWEDRMVGYQEPLRQVRRAPSAPQRSASTFAPSAPIAANHTIQQQPLAPLPQLQIPASRPVM